MLPYLILFAFPTKLKFNFKWHEIDVGLKSNLCAVSGKSIDFIEPMTFTLRFTTKLNGNQWKEIVQSLSKGELKWKKK